MGRRYALMGWGLVCFGAIAGMASPTLAQRGLDVEALRERLFSSNAAEVEAALNEVVLDPSGPAAAAVGERIRYGMPMNLLLAALDALRAVALPEAGDTLVMLTRHRRSEIRLRAVQALVACRPAGAAQVLEVRVSDSDPVVRAAAASGLGQLGAAGAQETLFLALDRGVLEAAVAIGQVTDAQGLRRLLGYLGRVPFGAITPALSEALLRRDIPMPVKASVLARLEELGTAEVLSYLNTLASGLTGARDAALRRSVQSTIVRLGG